MLALLQRGWAVGAFPGDSLGISLGLVWEQTPTLYMQPNQLSRGNQCLAVPGQQVEGTEHFIHSLKLLKCGCADNVENNT